MVWNVEVCCELRVRSGREIPAIKWWSLHEESSGERNGGVVLYLVIELLISRLLTCGMGSVGFSRVRFGW